MDHNKANRNNIDEEVYMPRVLQFTFKYVFLHAKSRDFDYIGDRSPLFFDLFKCLEKKT